MQTHIDAELTHKRKVQEYMVHQRAAVSSIAQFAMQLMTMAMHVGTPDGETSTGEQKQRLLTPEETTERAIKIADLAFAEFEKRGWVIETPSLATLLQDSERTGF